MAFASVSWTNGDTITEVKLDQMVANEVHNRHEINQRTLVSDGGGIEVNSSFVSVSPSASLWVDSVLKGSGVTADGDHIEGDLDISGLTDDAIYDIELTLSGGGASTTASWKFFKSPDIEYLTYWVTLDSASDGSGGIDLYARNITIIGHKEIKSWT